MPTIPSRTKYCRPSDIVTSLATITASGTVSSDPDYGLTALYDRNPAKPTHFDTVGPIRLVYDFGSARRIDAFALPNHNLDNGLDCIVALNATNSWASPTVSVGMEVGNAMPDGHRSSPWADFTTASGYSTGGFRYLSLYIPANSVNVKLGETLAISQLREFSEHTQFGNRGYAIPYLESLMTEYGVQRVYRRRVSKRSYQGSIKGNEQDWNDLKALVADAGGMALPFFFCWESQNKTDEGLYVRFTKESAAALQGQEEWFDFLNLRISVEELSRSLPL